MGGALGLKWCEGAILRHEARSGLKFEVVAFMRPDLLLSVPVSSWCSWRSRHRTLACEAPAADGLWIAPREQVARITSLAAQHASCEGEGTQIRKIRAPFEKHERKGVGGTFFGNRYGIKMTCCGGSEALLAYALHRRPGYRWNRMNCKILSPLVGSFCGRCSESEPRLASLRGAGRASAHVRRGSSRDVRAREHGLSHA